MQILKIGSTGHIVVQWQQFLRGQKFMLQETSFFDDATYIATANFQKKYRLDIDGVVGNQTLGKAAMLGFELVDYSTTQSTFPPLPNFPPLIGNNARQSMFGPLVAVPSPTVDKPERIKITNNWQNDNLVKTVIPQLVGIDGAPQDGAIWFNRKVANQFTDLWSAWENAGLLSKILTFDGAYNPRYIRGGAKNQILSNHAFATAFDINYAWNKLGAEPATFGQEGCVYELVPIAHRFGFYWGGHFSTRKDGMHFEVAEILDPTV